MVNIYDQIASNKRKTLITIILFMIFISILGYFLGEMFYGYGYGISTMVSAFVFSAASAFFSYFFSDKVVLGVSGAKKVDVQSDPRLYGMVENLCVGAGLKKVPDLYVINDTAPNAFATGRDPDHAAVAVTSGLLQKLDKRQLEGVIAHELSHIRNYDILIMTIVVVLVGTVTMVANMMFRGRWGGNDRRSGGVLILIGLLLALLSPIFAQLIKFAVSRSREYLADASASLLTRDPEGLAQALEIISADKEPLEVANEATAHLYISNPLRKGLNADSFANLFSTHPPIQDRIRRLREM